MSKKTADEQGEAEGFVAPVLVALVVLIIVLDLFACRCSKTSYPPRGVLLSPTMTVHHYRRTPRGTEGEVRDEVR